MGTPPNGASQSCAETPPSVAEEARKSAYILIMAKTSSTQNNDRRVATQKSAKKSSGGGDERFDVFILSAQERFVNGKIDAKLVKEKKTSGK